MDIATVPIRRAIKNGGLRLGIEVYLLEGSGLRSQPYETHFSQLAPL